MLWYFLNKNCYDYNLKKEIINSLTQKFRNSVYENSNEMELYYALQYMKENNIENLSVIFPIEDISINYGRAEDINKEFCDENNILYRYENRGGGCMVLFPENIIIYDVRPGNNFKLQEKFSTDFSSFLEGKNIKCEVTSNDILIEGKKIVGIISELLPEPYSNLVYTGISISINSDINLIKQVCLKPMHKIPGSLSKYSIFKDEMMEWLLNWFYNYDKEN